MNLELILGSQMTKEQNKILNDWISDDHEKFDLLMSHFLYGDVRVCQRASWVFCKVCEDRPWMMIKWIPKILKAMEQPKHNAIVRNSVRAFQFLDKIPEEYEGQLFEICFQYLVTPSSPIAIKAFSMSVCRKIAMKYPDLKGELIDVIEEVMVNGSAGIISRGKREIRFLANQ